MSDFVTDLTTLPFPKTNKNPLPVGEDPTKFVVAVDWNAVCQACVDLRTHVTALEARQIIAGSGLSGGGTLGAGDVTLSFSAVLAAIATSGSGGDLTGNSVTNAKLATMAAATIKGSVAGGTPVDLTATQATALLNAFSTTLAGLVPASGSTARYLKGDGSWSDATTLTAFLNAFSTTLAGLVPASGGGTTNFLRADGAWAAPTVATPGYGQFGDGSDGVGVMDGSTAVNGCTRSGSTYTATRTCFFTNLTISVGVTFKPDGWPIFGTGTLTNNGDINVNGGDAVTTTDGAISVSGTRFLPIGLAASNSSARAPQAASAATGGGGTAGTGAGNSGGTGTTGGILRGGGGGGEGVNGNNTAGGGSGGAAPTNTLVAADKGDFRLYPCATTGRFLLTSVPGELFTCGTGGGQGAPAGGAGGRGAPAAWMVLAFVAFSGSGTIRAKGGAGGVGQNGANGSPAGQGKGGGGGGAGGIVVIMCGGGTPPTPDVSGGAGGAGGTGGTGTPNGGNGGNGGAGGAGYAVVFR